MRFQAMLHRRSARRAIARGRSRRPIIEPLEGRVVPASYSASSVGELVAAINAANLTREADTITLAAGRTFTLTASDNTTDGPTGLPVVAGGEDLTIVGNGDVIERSTATGTPAFRLFDVAAGGSLRLQNLSLQGGLFYPGLGQPAQGGAVYNQGALSLSSVVVQNNTAQGLDSDYYTSAAFGGALYSAGSLVMTECTIRNNAAIGAVGRNYFGYVFPGADARGGGLYVAGGTAAISNSTFTTNTAQGGAGVFIGADGGNGFGGGLYAAGGTITVLNTQVSQNSATGGQGGSGAGVQTGANGGYGLGGGLYAAGALVTLRDTSVTENTAIGGAGGTGGKHQHDGYRGKGVGGGLYIDPLLSSVSLDPFTKSHVKRNKASTSDYNISGLYDLDP